MKLLPRINRTLLEAHAPGSDRGFEDLNRSEQNQMRAIKAPADLKSVEYLNDWMDDHILCVGAKINGVPVGFWWIGHDGAADIKHAGDSPTAKKGVVEIVKQYVEAGEDELRDNPDAGK